MKKVTIDQLRNADLYSQTEASHYLCIPTSTLRYWAIGETTPKRSVKPLIQTAGKFNRLSFLNLVELHLLNSLRKKYNIDMIKIRKSLDYLKRELKAERPLLTKDFETDGVDLFIDHYGNLVNVSSSGQQAMRELLLDSLTRVERDAKKIPIKLFPYTHSVPEDSPTVISMSPTLFSGRPVIDGTGIATAIIADRYKAGDSVSVLADDYGVDISKVEEAIRCELQVAA